MLDHNAEQELRDRLSVIENMLAEGRRTTESWGWTFVLWGIVYCVAIVWANLSHNLRAWPITVCIGVVLTILIASKRRGGTPKTTLGKTIGCVWIAAGISMCVLFPALGFSGRLGYPHIFFACVSAILGLANGASALIIRWNLQLACAVVWWVAAAATCFGSDGQSTVAFLVAIFLCLIVFGTYGMIAGTQHNKRRGLAHA
ncbi:MAG TPA: hypothetical protein VFA90_01180 [Terriglobales bacterium]|nr:hypothetical protein [Terriglobales bacterium]